MLGACEAFLKLEAMARTKQTASKMGKGAMDYDKKRKPRKVRQDPPPKRKSNKKKTLKIANMKQQQKQSDSDESVSSQASSQMPDTAPKPTKTTGLTSEFDAEAGSQESTDGPDDDVKDIPGKKPDTEEFDSLRKEPRQDVSQPLVPNQEMEASQDLEEQSSHLVVPNVTSTTIVVPPKTPDRTYIPMSFVKVAGSPTWSKQMTEQVQSTLQKAFNANLNELESAARKVLPDINSLSPKATKFLVSIFGDENILPVKHNDEDLAEFLSLGTSLKFAALATNKVADGSYQLRLRYFAGLGNDDMKDRSSPEQAAAVLVAKGIKRFFTSIFNNPENAPIEECVSRSRSLYITVKSSPHKATPDKSQSSEVPPEELVSSSTMLKPTASSAADETIVACINFSIMDGGHGFFVNWLATSNEEINQRKYGTSLQVVCANGTWQRRHLALFLLKAAHVSVILHLRMAGSLQDQYHIVLQARTSAKEKSAHFYTKVGFEEGGVIDKESELSSAVFSQFPTVLETASKSNTDYMHWIWDTEDICVFKNSSGSFGDLRSFAKRLKSSFPKIVTSDTLSVTVPFALSREHYVLLSYQLEFFLLPFQKNADHQGFIMPNRLYDGGHFTLLNDRALKSIRRNAGWLTDEAIDLYIRW